MLDLPLADGIYAKFGEIIFWSEVKSMRSVQLFAILPLFIAGCSCVKTKIQLHGKFGPYALETTVDSPYAVYYVENYLAGKMTDSSLDAKLDCLHRDFADIVPQREALRRISKEYSVDFAALFWGHQLLSIPENEAIQRQFVEHLQAVQAGKLEVQSKEYSVILVPGLDYKENGHLTGADLKTQIELFRNLGVNVHFVEIPPMGNVHENALMVANAIRNHPDGKILLAGPSSAGAAIHVALGQVLSSRETESVAAWLNLGGIVNGSPVIDWMDSGITSPIWRLILWSQGWPYATFQGMRADVSRKRAATLSLPGHIKVINYIGLSLSGNTSRFGRDKYCLMRSQGPNDGLALLPDMVAPNSYTIIAPTSDHFFAEDPSIKEKTIALLKTVIGII